MPRLAVWIAVLLLSGCSAADPDDTSDAPAANDDRRICETAEELPINDGLVESLARNAPDSQISGFALQTVEDWRSVPAGGDNWEENLNEAADIWQRLVDLCVQSGY